MELQIAALALALFHSGGAAVAPNIEGSYVAQRLNGRAVPAEMRIATTQGDFRLFRLEQAVLRLGSHGRFTLYFRYYHQLVRKGARPRETPVMSESESGTYTATPNQLVLVPARKDRARRRPTILATISGEEIHASYLLENGVSPERVTLLLRRDPSYW